VFQQDHAARTAAHEEDCMTSWTLNKLAALVLGSACVLSLASTSLAQPAPAAKAFEPRLGQSGKDVMWLPTKEAIVERLFQMGEVTRRDFIVDLGSGDGNIPIAAARQRGARALGIEYNPNMVEVSKRRAIEAGVQDKVEFLQADIFVAEYSKASVVTLYLLPELNLRLRPTLLKMKPGTRILSNSWDMQTWQPDETSAVSQANANAYLWVIPARVDGNWAVKYRAAAGALPVSLALRQRFQMVEGDADFRSFKAVLQDTRLRGDTLRFDYRDSRGEMIHFVARVEGDRMTGTATSRQGRTHFEAKHTSTPTPFEEAVATPQEIADAVRVLGNQ